MIRFVVAIISLLLLAAAAGIGLLFSMGYSLPGPADLKAVRTKVVPTLQTQLQSQGFEWGQPIHIRIFKEPKELEVWLKKGESFSLFKTYPICAYSGILGPKLKEGDRQSPEGFYRVTSSQMKPDSRYHLAFNIGFPNAYDRSKGRTGSYLMVHGNCLSVGCYAMTDAQMEEIYLLAQAALEQGQAAFDVHIYPFHMTQEAMNKHARSEWLGFWSGLKKGYDHFEQHHVPLDEDVLNVMTPDAKTNP